jgi:carbon-monoxide dehydrogenase medium subunit
MTHHVQLPGTDVARVVTPGSLDEALAALADPGAKPLAGGTDLLVELARGEHRDLGTLVDLTRIPGLDDIDVDDGVVTIGALVTHNRVVAHPGLQRVAAPLVQACREVGSPQLRNRATVVGNVVTASPANDSISALAALDAEVVVASRRRVRRIPLARFHPGLRRTALEPGELVTAIAFPALAPPWRGIFLKLGNRRAQAISVVHLALVCRLEPDTGPDSPPVVAEARLALGSVAPTVVRVGEVEALLAGAALDGDTIARAASAAAAAVQPIGDVRATADYRRRLVAEMVARALGAMADGDRADPAAGVVDADPVLLWGRGDGRWPTGPPHSADHGPDTPVEAVVNGRPVVGERGDGTLLDWLRRAGLTGTKEGCAEGECGACTVHLDGMAVLACLVPPSRADGAEVVTVEGLAGPGGEPPGGALHPLQQAFVETGAVQCGYCIPGFLVSGAKLLEECPAPSGQQVVDGLAGNLCRCTGYYKIVEAFVRAGGAPAGAGDDQPGGGGRS